MAAIVYDGLRLFLNAFSGTPRGVDRVDFSYAQFLLNHWPDDCFGVLPTPWGMRLYDRNQSLRLLSSVKCAWRESQDATTDDSLAALQAWLAGGESVAAPSSRRKSGSLPDRTLRLLRENGFQFGQPVVECAPANSVYLNVNQVGWASRICTRWLQYRQDILPIFMLHDVIPAQHPALVSAGGRLSYDWMLKTVLRRAAGLITTTRFAQETILGTLSGLGLVDIPMRAVPLPVPDVFVHHEPTDEGLRRTPYFVVCGAIEPRKNHLLLLNVWRRLVKRVGADAPRLIVVGRPAYQGDRILRQLNGVPELRNHITVVSGLASPSLRRLMANACAVLMPSLAEGFGLPVVEALTVGSPILASDLPAHRESGGGLGRYLDPVDDIAWYDAIMEFVEDPGLGDRLRQQIASYRPLRAEDYFRSVMEFIQGFDEARLS